MTVMVSIPSLKHLPYTLDLSCPVSFPVKNSTGTQWPFDIAGPSSSSTESTENYIQRRYFETLYLSDALSSLPNFITDIIPLAIPDGTLLRPLLLSLPQIESRHRKILSPLISSLMVSSVSDLQQSILEDVTSSSSLSQKEIDVLKIALELRTGCRAVAEGESSLTLKKVVEELERREVLIQIILLLLYSSSPKPLIDSQGNTEKKRKREKRREGPSEVLHPTDDPKTSLELLTDRLSVWQAVAELGIGMDEEKRQMTKDKGKEKAAEGVQGIFQRFWEEVILVQFINRHPDFCAAFHLKLFGQPIPAKHLPASHAKKARKPKITHPHPSTTVASTGLSLSVPSRHATGSRASSEALSVRRGSSVSRDIDARSTSMRRSESRTESLAPEGSRRSRSRSIDPVGHGTKMDVGKMPPGKKTFGRAPSSAELFKGREVGLMRRTNSTAVKKDKSNDKESQESSGQRAGLGLLGRKTSDPIKRRDSGESQNSGQPTRPVNTIIFATPSKPRPFFGSRPPVRAQGQWYHPTPIQEEPSSDDRVRASYVAETPVGHNRMGPPMRVEAQQNRDIQADIDEGEESDDPLAELMVMTDEEDEDESDSRNIVPETPAR